MYSLHLQQGLPSNHKLIETPDIGLMANTLKNSTHMQEYLTSHKAC